MAQGLSNINQGLSNVIQAPGYNKVPSTVIQPSSPVITQASSRPTTSSPAMAPTPLPTPTPTPNPTIPQPTTSDPINYGIDDVLDDIHVSDQPTEPAPAPTVVEDEVCFTLPFRQGGFFRTWLNSFFVINREMIIMYPNEKRSDRKRKEILLYDATASVHANQFLYRSIPKFPATPNTPSASRFGQVPVLRGRRTL